LHDSNTLFGTQRSTFAFDALATANGSVVRPVRRNDGGFIDSLARAPKFCYHQ
jgi:hypothetical protein